MEVTLIEFTDHLKKLCVEYSSCNFIEEYGWFESCSIAELAKEIYTRLSVIENVDDGLVHQYLQILWTKGSITFKN